MLRSLRVLARPTFSAESSAVETAAEAATDRLRIRAKSDVVRVFRALHPPSEVADLALEQAGLPPSVKAKAMTSSDRGDSALRRHRAVAPVGGERLQTLWSLSRSHGVSWDEVDEIFFKFLAEREQRASLWQKEREAMAAKADDLVQKREGALKAGPLRKKRLAKLTAWSRKNLEFFKSEDLEEILNDFVTKKVIERETMERLR